jgi:hypothetical protein
LALTTISSENAILDLSCQITDKGLQDLFYDVFTHLQKGAVTDAKNRVDLYFNEIRVLEALTEQEKATVIPGEDLIDLQDFTADVLEYLITTAPYYRWMLFMHPDQRAIVEKDYSGPAKLTGVSGSGKTCVIVRRAIRLAQKYHPEKVLIITLNRALAQLIATLVQYACPETAPYRKNIIVLSFPELCRSLLVDKFDKAHANSYDSITWKLNERIEEIWREYYHCEANNEDAAVLYDVHKTLLVREVFPEDYLYQEFTWIRSAFAPERRREAYLNCERQGRSEGLPENYREMILEGLKGWEEKMAFVGGCDDLGLVTAACRYLDKITPEYRCILVDEVQDFGAIELRIVRQLAAAAENDIFLTGDIAQQVHTKFHNLAEAGIDCIRRSFKIKKNYRNSCEILQAAYSLLSHNLPKEQLRSKEFEILAPEYSEFSTPRPLLLKARKLTEEIGHCCHYLKRVTEPGKKAVIIICGYSLHDMMTIGTTLNLSILTTQTLNFDACDLYVSDLEQTKGFEFDRVCILGCEEGVIPDPQLPADEAYREISKLYVAMTRAKIELIISYSKKLSHIFDKCRDDFNDPVHWSEHEPEYDLPGLELPVPDGWEGHTISHDYLDLPARMFFYRREAVGISREVMDRLEKLVTGRKVIDNGVQQQWRTIGEMLKADRVALGRAFGSSTATLEATENLFLSICTESDEPPEIRRRRCRAIPIDDAPAVAPVSMLEKKRKQTLRSKLPSSLMPLPSGLKTRDQIEALPITNLKLSVRTYNCLQAKGIRTVGDLIQRSEHELLRFRNFGRSCLNEVKQKLASLGCTLGETSQKPLIPGKMTKAKGIGKRCP